MSDNQYIETYEYDSLGRLIKKTEGNSTNQVFAQPSPQPFTPSLSVWEDLIVTNMIKAAIEPLHAEIEALKRRLDALEGDNR